MGQTTVTAEPGTALIVVERHFAAPPAVLYRAWTEPELIVRWLGPDDLEMTVHRYELRDGGRWRYSHRDPAGNEYGFHGVFHGEPSIDGGMVQTFEFEGMPGHVSLDTLTLTARDGGTLVRTTSAFQSVAARDGMVASGMESGMNQGFDKLDVLLPELIAAG